MSKIIKCKICEVAKEEDCQLMQVVINKDGVETKYCCEHLQRDYIKKI